MNITKKGEPFYQTQRRTATRLYARDCNGGLHIQFRAKWGGWYHAQIQVNGDGTVTASHSWFDRRCSSATEVLAFLRHFRRDARAFCN